jgi:hypothetical protein
MARFSRDSVWGELDIDVNRLILAPGLGSPDEITRGKGLFAPLASARDQPLPWSRLPGDAVGCRELAVAGGPNALNGAAGPKEQSHGSQGHESHQ